MNQGLLVESGTHKELILKKNGYYRDLYEIQFKKEKTTEVQFQE
jgi:subfamily B ATP-binding cassette protein MsbA